MTSIETWALKPATLSFNDLSESLYNQIDNLINRIANPYVQQFVIFGLTRVGNEKKLCDAIYLTEFGIEYFKARGMYNEINPSKQSDTAIAAMLMHNLYYDATEDNSEDNWINVFLLRKEMNSLAVELYGQNYKNIDVFEYIYQIVEAQLGEDMPPVGNRPVNGQYTYIVWELIWIYYNWVAPLKNGLEELKQQQNKKAGSDE